jgi:hypothetical protein
MLFFVVHSNTNAFFSPFQVVGHFDFYKYINLQMFLRTQTYTDIFRCILKNYKHI